MKIIEQYVCEICGTTYLDIAKARTCEAQGPPSPRFVVGDIVTVGMIFGWFDGDKRWVLPRKKIGDQSGFLFYYVVTVIDQDDSPWNRGEHRVRYHVFTKAMVDRGYRSGYTFDRGHYAPTKVKRVPAFVLQDSRRLLGQKANSLL